MEIDTQSAVMPILLTSFMYDKETAVTYTTIIQVKKTQKEYPGMIKLSKLSFHLQ